MPRPLAFTCSRCGQLHDELPMSFGAAAPAYYYAVPEEQRPARCLLNDDLCIIDGEQFFIRGCLEVPVPDGPGPPVGQRPLVELEPTEHPLAVEQRQGISMQRVQAIAEALLHPPDNEFQRGPG
jgi:hypothetical protein